MSQLDASTDVETKCLGSKFTILRYFSDIFSSLFSKHLFID